jgi:hypothetical protein
MTAFLEPASGSSGTNAVLVDVQQDCRPLGDIEVSLLVSEDLVTANDVGFSLQLNAYPTPGINPLGTNPLHSGTKTLNWIQYTINVGFISNKASFQWQAWCLGRTDNEPTDPARTSDPQQIVPPFDQPDRPEGVFRDVPNNRLPNGSAMIIRLTTDPSSHAVTQATFGVNVGGADFQSVTVPLQAQIDYLDSETPPQPGVATAQFPITGFQVNLVGPSNLSDAPFTSGAGQLVCVQDGASRLLAVQNGGVGSACGQYKGAVTGETSNILYGPVTQGAVEPSGEGLFQSFGLFRGAKTFSGLFSNAVYVVDRQNNLWRDQAPFGPNNLPPFRTQVDENAVACSAVDNNRVYVLGSDGNLWLAHAPFGPPNLPPIRALVDTNANDCSAVDFSTVYVVGSDGNLWLVQAPFGPDPVPPLPHPGRHPRRRLLRG